MAYVALYRKYRSQSFGELMGQEAVTRTLQNALATGRFAHAYLFHGARGCGKTSTARLLARALNCAKQDGPTPEPCGECRLCVSIREGTCMDVVEIDAASETSIDDVREKIIENVQYAPTEARFKVYIIDEVHDLSAKAFDALLKTLEEPPAHVVFVLATTEFQKVPITIRSRCQQYQFKRGTLQDLACAVQNVIDKEDYTAELEAVQAIARSAEGSWRDALSLLEQVLAYSDKHITAATVHRAIGTVGSDVLARVMETLATGRMDATFAMSAELVDSGTDVRQLFVALSNHIRNLLLIAAGAGQQVAQELGADRLAMMLPQAAMFAPETLLAMMGVLSSAERELKNTNQHRVLLEMTLLRLLPGSLVASTAPQAAVTLPASRPVMPAPEVPTTSVAAVPTVVPKPPISVSPTVDLRALPADEEDEEEEETAEETVVEEEVVVAAVSVPSPPPVSSQPESKPATVEATPAPSNEHRFADELTLEVVQRAWPRILKYFEKASPVGYPHLKNAEVVALEGKTISLQFANEFARNRIQGKEKGRQAVEQTINKILNAEGYKITCILATSDQVSATPLVKPTGGEATIEMPVLLDAPTVTVPTTSKGFGDFEMPAPPPPMPNTTAHNGNGANGTTPPAAAPVQKAETPLASNGLLAEALDIFGGEVVKSEPIN